MCTYMYIYTCILKKHIKTIFDCTLVECDVRGERERERGREREREKER